jgi:hypothetical protein
MIRGLLYLQMLEMKHNNLNAFIGASVTPPHFCTVWEYCSKGSLQDVIFNEAIQLDDMFKFSICIDMLKVRCLIIPKQLLFNMCRTNNVTTLLLLAQEAMGRTFENLMSCWAIQRNKNARYFELTQNHKVPSLFGVRLNRKRQTIA